jgi:hypothetical protein
MGNVDDPTRRVGIGSNNELSAGASQQSPDWLEISVESALHEFWQYRRDIRAEGAVTSQVTAGGND